MKTNKLTAISAAFALALLINAPCGSAQEATPAPAATPAADAQAKPGQPSGDRMEQFRQRMNDFIKTSLKVSDEEWSVIEPLLSKVQTKQRDALLGRFSFFGNRSGGRSSRGDNNSGGADRANRPDRPASPELDALKAALDAESTPPAEIKAKLEAVRAARKKATAELEQAREDLRKVLTQRQEATLVMTGILE